MRRHFMRYVVVLHRMVNVLVLCIHSMYIIANSGKQVTQRISILDFERTLNEILII